MQNSSINSNRLAPLPRSNFTNLPRFGYGGSGITNLPKAAGTSARMPPFPAPSNASVVKRKPLKRVTLSEHVEIEGFKHKITLPENGPTDRDEYIEYALDMLIHNLIGSGQLDPSHANLVKTPELRSHVSNLVDRVETAHKAGMSTQIYSKPTTHNAVTKWALQPNSLPITIITDKDPTVKPVKRPFNKLTSRPGSISTPAPTPLQNKRTNVLNVPISTKPKPGVQQEKDSIKAYTTFPVTTNRKPIMKGISSSTASTTTDRPHTATSTLTVTTGDHHGGSDQHLDLEDKYRFKPAISVGNDGGFRAKFDMRGFENEEISLALEDGKLTVTGTRPKGDGMNDRKTIESVDIPIGVNTDQLKVARRVDGILLIQESPLERRELII